MMFLEDGTLYETGLYETGFREGTFPGRRASVSLRSCRFENELKRMASCNLELYRCFYAALEVLWRKVDLGSGGSGELFFHNFE